MPANSMDAVVCDPPYGLEFMGKEWDKIADDRWHHQWAAEAFRVLKPGGFILAFGGTRTYHRLAVAIEDAGFEIRDQIDWIYNSGFPKSFDMGRTIDKAEGLLEDRGHAFNYAASAGALAHEDSLEYQRRFKRAEPDREWQPKSEQAKKWNGWGTALKPAHEPIAVGRKPPIGTVAENLAKYGTGAVNIDATRVASDEPNPSIKAREDRTTPLVKNVYHEGLWPDARTLKDYKTPHPGELFGRWPPNVLLDPSAAEEMDRQSGTTKDGGEGGSSRFFPVFGNDVEEASFAVVPKASRSEREAGLDGMPSQTIALARDADQPGLSDSSADYRERWVVEGVRNIHPTVKPIALMRWLVRLVAPRGATVLDPFAGSGTTGIAALLEDINFIGIEKEDKYADIADARIAYWEKHRGEAPDIPQALRPKPVSLEDGF